MPAADRERKLRRLAWLEQDNMTGDINKSTFTRISQRMLLETLKHDNVVLLNLEVK
jgi:hypothetical protein